MGRELNKEIFDSLYHEEGPKKEPMNRNESRAYGYANPSPNAYAPQPQQNLSQSHQTPSFASAEMDSHTFPNRGGTVQPYHSNFEAKNDEMIKKLTLANEKLSRKVESLEGQLKALESRMLEFVKATKKNFDRVNARQQGFEESYREYTQQMASKVSVLTGRIKEKVVSDHKVQGLLDRHNTVVQSFETQMSQMKKMLSQKEFEILSYKSQMKK